MRDEVVSSRRFARVGHCQPVVKSLEFALVIRLLVEVAEVGLSRRPLMMVVLDTFD